MTSAPIKFAAGGAVGFVVQVSALAILSASGLSWLPATLLAVETAIVHNYFWHSQITWKTRFNGFTGAARFARFNASMAVTSIGGNVLLMAVFVGFMGMPVVLGNVAAVAVLSLVNFFISDRWVFAALLCLVAVPAHAMPNAESIAAWNRYVAAAEARIAAEPTHSMRQPPQGNTIDVGPATISDWRGSVFIPHVTLDAFLHRLQNPGTPPPQEDVAAARVISRTSDSLHLYIRLVRHAVVTVTYDTEHDMTFRRLSATTAAARSVATRIDEIGGGDRGFLWRLNSYWHYEQADDGVAVSLESLTLSRDVPMVIKPVAGLVVPRIARESILRTLEALRAYFP